MDFYKVEEKENGDIILTKTIIELDNYIINKENDNNKLILSKIKNVKIKQLSELSKYNFSKSIIIKCLIDNDEYDKLKYKSILLRIYELINSGKKIIKNTLLNIETIEKNDDGFYYIENLGISIQGVDSNKCIKEIMNQCIINNLSIKMNIRLNNNILINIQI